MGLFSSRSSSETRNINEVNNQGFSEVQGPAIAAGKGARVTFFETDAGAVREALGFASDFGADALETTRDVALAAVRSGREQTTEVLGAVTAQNRAFTGELARLVQAQGKSNDERLLQLGALAVAGVVAATVLPRVFN